MVTTKHCCYGDCKSDSRKLDNNSGIFFIGFGNGFPKPNKEPEKCKRWIQMCGRKYFTIHDVKKDTYICSLHFIGGKGPTDEHPDPVKCGTQRLKAAVHYTTMKICREHTAEKGLELNRMVLAAISEATWKKCEEFATDLELFAKHAKRTTVTADDVKLLVRKTPRLLQHINSLHETKTAGKAETKKKSRKPKSKNTTSSTAKYEHRSEHGY